MPSQVTLKDLLEVGVHFGHRTQKWDPKMEPYIFTSRNGIHILDLQQTIKNLNKYHDLIRDTVMDGGEILFVGTKRQASETIAKEAKRCGMPYVNYRWLGGTLTNWATIRTRIQTLKDLEKRRDSGEFDLLTKKEALMLEREIDKLELRLGGIRDMNGLPDMVFIVDTVREDTAVRECNILDIPLIALVDSNSNPDEVDYILPANDDAMRAINLMVKAIADAVIEGKAMSKGNVDDGDDVSTMEEAMERYGDMDSDDSEGTDEDYLGEKTLAKIRRQSEAMKNQDNDEDDE